MSEPASLDRAVRDPARLVAVSDGVIAIAVPLLGQVALFVAFLIFYWLPISGEPGVAGPPRPSA